MRALERRTAELEAELAGAEAPAPRLHPGLAEGYRARVAELTATLAADGAAELRERVRALVEEVRPTPERGKLRIEVRGELGAVLLRLAEGAQTRRRPGAGAAGTLSGSFEQIKEGAGAGFEPAAFRL